MILPDRHWDEAGKDWRAAEELGFDSAWTYDHMSWGPLEDSPWFSPYPVLAAAANSTHRIQLGTLVTSPNFRHPVTTVKDAITVDDISQGRFVLGIGAGSTTAGDDRVVDPTRLSLRDRTARFAEFVELTDLMLREPLVTYEGRFFSAFESRNVASSRRRPSLPVAVAATGPRGLELAARHGSAWVTFGAAVHSRKCTPEETLHMVRSQLDGLTKACDQIGRDPAELGKTFVVTDLPQESRSPSAFLEYARSYAAIGITDLVIHWPRPSGMYQADPRMAHLIAEKALPEIQEM
ncbi:LLM class flavin-dependent oxidoreductase [Streptomyces sp. NPDC017979]|uniref:LLM class flavin-dependent oxidoreductase n=1 Tax=Streptomyces sp. NPDC017979 TaxID=3365024 RepID=UPI0037A03A12